MRLLALGLASIFLFGCNSAELSDVNRKFGDDDTNEKLECRDVNTAGVHKVDLVWREVGEGQTGYYHWEQKELIGSMTAFEGLLDPKTNYNFVDEMAQPIHGLQPLDRTATHFTYQFEGQTYLYLIIKNQRDAISSNIVHMNVSVRNNDLADNWVFWEDSAEVGKDRNGDEHKYTASFDLTSFTDGLVIGPLQSENWRVLVQYRFDEAEDIQSIKLGDQLVGGMSYETNGLKEFLIRPSVIDACSLPN